MDWSSIVQFVLEGVVSIALAVLVPLVIRWLQAKIAEMNAAVGSEWAMAIDQAVDEAVRTVEQMKLAKMIGSEAQEAKQKAITVAERYLAERGVTVDLLVLADMIEAEVARLNWNRIKPV